MFSFSQHTISSRVVSFFKPHERKNDYYTCKLCEDEKKVMKPISGKSKPNLRAHLANVHPKEFMEYCSPSKKFPLANKRKVMMQSFAEIITVNGRAFEWLKDSGFQRLIKCDLEEVSDGGMPINFSDNYKELKSYIAYIATTIRNNIKEDLKNQHISIMMDIGTKNNKSLLGINSQCMINDDVVIHSLGVIPLDSAHKAPYIRLKLTDCLKVYDIEPDSVVSFTTDNAKNMIATSNKFDEYLKMIGELENANCGDNNGIGTIQRKTSSSQLNEISDPLNEHELRGIFDQAADDEELERIINAEDDFEQLFSEIIGNMEKITTLVNTVRCGAHTVQLMVRDALDSSNFKQILTLCRSIVKLLRTQKLQHEAKDVGIDYTLPLMFCTTRWDGDLLMVSTILHKYQFVLYN